MSSTITPDETLPSPAFMNRDDLLDLFVRIVNLVEPEHKYNEPYPISPNDVEFSYCTRYWAKCGPRHGGAYYAVDASYMKSQSIERVLAINAHEIAHLKYGVTRGQPTHPKEFWQAMAFYSSEMRDQIDTIESWLDCSIDVEWFEREVVNDPNSSTVDRRIETVEQCRTRMAELLGLDSEIVQ